MPFLPDWAPNLHPVFVHFPIAILITAIFVDIALLFIKKFDEAGLLPTTLFLFGALSAVVTYFTGHQAADHVTVPPLANPVLNEHSDMAMLTMLFFLTYAIVRLYTFIRKLHHKRMFSILQTALSLIGLFMLYETGEHGSELVYKYGVGVKAAVIEAEMVSPPPEVPVQSLSISDNGSWAWDPGNGAGEVLKNEFDWLMGSVAATRPEVIPDSVRGMVLRLHLADKPILLAAGDSLKSVQVDLSLNISGFEGEVRLIHHLGDTLSYDFIGLKDRSMELGRVERGKMRVMDRASYDATGWISLRAVGDGRHFRGFVNDKLVTHGHADELPPGRVGLLVDGRGVLLIDKISVTSLK